MKRLLLVALILLSACTATRDSHSPKSIPCAVADALNPTPWYASSGIYRLRHDGVLRVGNSSLPMTGFMVLDMTKRQADVALLTGFGIKLATLRVWPHRFDVLSVNPTAKRIPHFIDQCAFSIQKIFLTDFLDKKLQCLVQDDKFVLTASVGQGSMRTVLDRHSHELQSKSFLSPSVRWRADYSGGVEAGAVVLPRRTVFTTKKYTVTLQLNEVK